MPIYITIIMLIRVYLHFFMSPIWFHQVALSNGRPVPAVLLANKCDQRRNSLCPKLPKLENFSKEYGFVGWYETSAKVRDHFGLRVFKFFGL